ECLRQKQFLRGHSLLFHSASQFFEQNPLVRGVLIYQNKAVRIFHQDIQLAQDTNDLELLLRSLVGVALSGTRIAGRIRAHHWQAEPLPYNLRWRCPAGVTDPGYSWTEMR